ncbi:DUF6941 family protein [Mycobacteroides abscessus]|uniref:DUF6941 family protein n=1 Tax=Mycobacteroides abscessus TaxID=36809 RepID=UPI000C25CCAD
MDLTFLLADAAQTDERGKISALGIGWTHIPTPTPPIALFAFADLEQHELPTEVIFRFALRNAAGESVVVPGQGSFSVEMKVAAPPNTDVARAGEPVRLPVSLQINAGIALDPGLYRFHAEITNGKQQVAEVRSFRVRPADETPDLT